MSTKIEVAKPESGIWAPDLYRVITEAMLFAGKDDTLPMLTCIKFQATGTHLIAAATDRFMLGVSSAAMISEPFEFVLQREQAKIIADIAGKGRRRRGVGVFHRADLALTPAGKRLWVTFNDFGDQVKVAVPTSSVTFPPYRKLLTEKFDADAQLGAIAVNPAYMAKFGKLVNSDRQMLMRFSKPSKPIQVTVGDDFVGLIMPVRLPGQDVPSTEGALPSWLPK